MSDCLDGALVLRLSRGQGLLVLGIVICMSLCVGAQASASLPDGRAWEMVSPLDKNGGDIVGIEGDNGGGIVQSTPEGQAVTFVSFAAFADPLAAPVGSQYLANRDAGEGWLAQNVSLPTNSQTVQLGGSGIPYRAFSPGLRTGVVYGGVRGGADLSHAVETPPLAGAPAGYENYYLATLPNSGLQSLLTDPPGVPPGQPPGQFGMEFLASTPDLSSVVVRSSAALGAHRAEEPGTSNLDEWESATGQFQLVNVLPDGTPEVEHFVTLGSGTGAQSHAISDDGSRVIWTGAFGLYMREGFGTGQLSTKQIDAPEGGGVFLTASSDERKIFFADAKRLTGDSTASGGGYGDLYMFEPDAGENGHLTDLTVDHHAGDEGGAEVQGVLGAGEDGSYLYFVANGVLAPGASLGDCVPGTPQPSATCNLYVWHEGEGIRFIAPLSADDEHGANFNSLGAAFDWSPRIGKRTARVSLDGARAVFMSERSLTGYDNTLNTGGSCGRDAGHNPLTAQCEQVFLYEAAANRLSCVSCKASGARPTGPSGIPGGTNFRQTIGQYQSRVLSEGGADGRVFFESRDGLVPLDTNGASDVYEYEDGHAYLLSDGRNAGGASFLDASVNGDDAFLITRAPLVSQDSDQLVDLYDARAPHAPGEAVGFPAPPVSNFCGGEDCRSQGLAAPANAPLSSVVFSGLGNVAPSAPKPVAKARKIAKPKPKPKKRRRRAKHGKKARAGNAAGSKRGRG